MNKNVGTSAGLVAFLTVMFHVVNTPRAERHSGTQARSNANIERPKPDQETKPDGKEPPIEGPWLATRAFFQSEGPDDPSFPDTSEFKRIDAIERCATDPACREKLKRYFGLERGNGYELEFLIATVPDPLHTRLSLFTDASLEAIEKAAFQARWELATQWLPWYDNPNPDEKAPKERRDQRREIHIQEKQPGLLIFRHEDNRVLFIFLAGETPTAGINGYQFRAARAYMRAFGDRKDVRIQGPTFSGSFFSLTQLIHSDQESTVTKDGDKVSYVVRTGTASNDHPPPTSSTPTSGLSFTQQTLAQRRRRPVLRHSE